MLQYVLFKNTFRIPDTKDNFFQELQQKYHFNLSHYKKAFLLFLNKRNALIFEWGTPHKPDKAEHTSDMPIKATETDLPLPQYKIPPPLQCSFKCHPNVMLPFFCRFKCPPNVMGALFLFIILGIKGPILKGSRPHNKSLEKGGYAHTLFWMKSGSEVHFGLVCWPLGFGNIEAILLPCVDRWMGTWGFLVWWMICLKEDPFWV